MACADLAPFAAVGRRLARQALARRIPCFGMFELTYRCNLECVHCYLAGGRSTPELPTAEVKRLIAEAAEAGCFSLLLTGGEPFVRADFREIYLHAKKLGLLIFLFTNGSAIPADFLPVLRRYPPALIDISLYGASEETYARVTGRAVYGSVMENLARLVDAGLPVKAKVTLLEENAADFVPLAETVRGLGLRLRLNLVMSHAYDGSSRPARHRIAPQRAVELEAADEEVAAGWRHAFSRREPPERETPQSLYRCGAGLNSFCITPDGQLKICSTHPGAGEDLAHRSFSQAWKALSIPGGDQPPRAGHECSGCRLAAWCLHCPAWARLDAGDEQAFVPYLCEITHRRAQRFGAGVSLEGPWSFAAAPCGPGQGG